MEFTSKIESFRASLGVTVCVFENHFVEVVLRESGNMCLLRGNPGTTAVQHVTVALSGRHTKSSSSSNADTLNGEKAQNLLYLNHGKLFSFSSKVLFLGWCMFYFKLCGGIRVFNSSVGFLPNWSTSWCFSACNLFFFFNPCDMVYFRIFCSSYETLGV